MSASIMRKSIGHWAVGGWFLLQFLLLLLLQCCCWQGLRGVDALVPTPAVKNAFHPTISSSLTRQFQSVSSSGSDGGHIGTTGAAAETASTSSPREQQSPSTDDKTTAAFHATLRELQKSPEPIPLWKCNASQIHTMNAALWTTLAQLSKHDSGQKVCLILEQIPWGAVNAFCVDYHNILTQPRLCKQLPELQRLQIDMVSTADQPAAVVLESVTRTPVQAQAYQSQTAISATLHETQCTTALQSFVSRIVVGQEACPYTKSPDWSATGLEKRGVNPGPVGYRWEPSADACAAMAAFWDALCELQTVPETKISTTLLSLPGIGPGKARQHHDRFAAVVELMSRNLCLFRGDAVFGLVHFHPAYQRNFIHPLHKPAFGHLPPQSWLRSMLRHNGQADVADTLTEEDLDMSNYQRRSPHTMINVLRASQLNAAVGAKSIVDLSLDNGTTEQASGIPLYSRNAIRLAQQNDRAQLQTALEAEMIQSLGVDSVSE